MPKIKNNFLIFTVFVFVSLFLSGCATQTKQAEVRNVTIPKVMDNSNLNINKEVLAPKESGNSLVEPKAGMANPASVFCVEKGGTSEIRTGPDGGQTGFCKFKDGKECEEWAMFREECPVGGR